MANRQLARERPSKTPYRKGLRRLYIPTADRTPGPRGTKIRNFRASAGLSQAALGKLMHVSLYSIYWWEIGSHEPTEVTWKAFQRVQRNWRQKLRRAGVDVDGGPFMEEE